MLDILAIIITVSLIIYGFGYGDKILQTKKNAKPVRHWNMTKITCLILACVCMMNLPSLTHASDMDCFNLSISQAQLKQAKGLKEIIKARRLVRQWEKFCLSNQPI